MSGVTTDQRGFPLDSKIDIGAFQSQAGLVVNTTGDGFGSPPGDLSLRQAVNLANVLGGSETITFDSTVFVTADTITLNGSQLELSDTSGTETITGPAAGLTVNGGGLSRVFAVDADVTASISGLTITGGNGGEGGGLYVAYHGTADLTDCTLSGNSAQEQGGGLSNAGTANLTNCTLSGNSAGTNGGGLENGGTASLTNCTVSGNTALAGGGVFTDGGTAILTDCALNGNSATYGAGGGVSSQFGTTNLTNCTVSGNAAVNGHGHGGGLYNGADGTMNLTACTVSGNTSSFEGGVDIYSNPAFAAANANLTNTIVAGNTVSGGAASDISVGGTGVLTGSFNLVGTGGFGRPQCGRQ